MKFRGINLDIKKTIEILLNGSVEHSKEEEIEEKLKQVEKKGRLLRLKLGLDPSAPDIHLGHCVIFRKLRQLQKLGHQVIIIFGDFTGMIGDPTGKSKTRKPLTKDQILENTKTYKDQIFKILDKDKTIVKFNSEWLEKLTLKDVVSLASKCTVAKMLEREDFKKRYNNHQSICIHEFLYPLMQGYDSVAIKSDIEFGGTDQIFNVLMGRSIQKDFGMEPQLAVFYPILEGTDGKNKMSKSLNNYIGIDEPANSIYVKTMKIPDELIIRYFTLCTDLHPEEIKKFKKALLSGENPRDIKMKLAYEITSLYHDEDEAKKAQDYFEMVYQKEEIPEDILNLEIENTTDSEGLNLINAISKTGDFKSKSDIRRIFSQRGAKINGSVIEDINDVKGLTSGTIVQLGKSKFYKVIV